MPLTILGFWTRLACGIVLTPAVVFVEYHLLRATGLSFASVATLLPLVNLPAAWLIFRAGDRPAIPAPRVILGGALTLVLPAVFLGIWTRDWTVRAAWGHAWYHADIVYMLAGGGLRPEEPQLAGLRLAYPWAVDLFHGITSFLLDQAPNSSYVWVNLVWLLCTLGFMAAVVKQLGGDRWARYSSVLLLCFGVNALGFIARHIAPTWLVELWPFLGDSRYTPWVRKFGVFEGSGVGIALLTALTLVVVLPWDSGRRRPLAALAFALLVALTLSYPIMFPVGVVLVGSRVLVGAIRSIRSETPGWPGELGRSLAVLIVAGLIGFAHLRFLTADRSAPTISLSSWQRMQEKVADSIVALGPLFAGVLIAGLGIARRLPEAAATLLLTAAACLVAYPVLDIEFPGNEYKFIFPAAICLAPFASIAWSGSAKRLGRAAGPLSVLGAMVLAAPAVKPVVTGWPSVGPRAPRIDVDHFAVRLREDEPYAALTDEVRNRAPGNAVLVAGSVRLDLVTPTGRPIYVPYEEHVFGLGMSADLMLTRTVGYDSALVHRRVATLHALFQPGEHEVEGPLAAIRAELRRPLVIILDPVSDVRLAAWLGASRDARMLYGSERQAAWLLAAPRSAKSSP